MRLGVFFAALTVGLTVAAGASALPQAPNRANSVTLSEAANASRNTGATPQRRGLRLNDNGRWGLDLNVNQPVGRENVWGDVEAGAFYRFNDRLRVGAAAAVAPPAADPARAPETSNRSQPRFRLESIFRF